MKIILKSLILTFFLLSCEAVTCGCVVSPENPLNGKWQLTKITYGYPAPNSPTFTTKVDEEFYELDTNSSTYKVTKKGKEIESGKISWEETNTHGFVEKFLNFQPSNTYSTYRFSDDFQELVLYQRTPIGVKLADGNNFHYQKIK